MILRLYNSQPICWLEHPSHFNPTCSMDSVNIYFELCNHPTSIAHVHMCNKQSNISCTCRLKTRTFWRSSGNELATWAVELTTRLKVSLHSVIRLRSLKSLTEERRGELRIKKKNESCSELFLCFYVYIWRLNLFCSRRKVMISHFISLCKSQSHSKKIIFALSSIGTLEESWVFKTCSLKPLIPMHR